MFHLLVFLFLILCNRTPKVPLNARLGDKEKHCFRCSLAPPISLSTLSDFLDKTLLCKLGKHSHLVVSIQRKIEKLMFWSFFHCLYLLVRKKLIEFYSEVGCKWAPISLISQKNDFSWTRKIIDKSKSVVWVVQIINPFLTI